MCSIGRNHHNHEDENGTSGNEQCQGTINVVLHNIGEVPVLSARFTLRRSIAEILNGPIGHAPVQTLSLAANNWMVVLYRMVQCIPRLGGQVGDCIK
jgi:hypothetical protein